MPVPSAPADGAIGWGAWMRSTLDTLWDRLATAPTGVAATDTATVQAAITSRTRLQAGTYVVNKLTIGTGQALLGVPGATIVQLASGANSNLLETTNWGTLTGTDNAATPYNFTVDGVILDGNKSAQTTGTRHGLAIYAYGYSVRHLTIRNCGGIGFWTEWASASPFLAPDGMEAFVTELKVHDCDGGAIRHAGPHDTIWSNVFVVQNSGTATGKAAVDIPVDGRANGSVFQMLHVYGGSYDYGLKVNSSGCEFVACQFEGAQVAQAVVQASINKFTECKWFPGGVATATVKGVVIGDSTHTNINNVRLSGKVEDCGGGALDLTNAAGDLTIDLTAQYVNVAVPASTLVGTVDANSRVNLTVISPAGVATEQSRAQIPGRLRFSGGTVPTGGFNGASTAGGSIAINSASTETRGQVTFTAPTTGGAAGTQFYVNWNGAARTSDVRVLLQAKNAAAAGAGAYVQTANWGFTVFTTAAPTAGGTYIWDWLSLD